MHTPNEDTGLLTETETARHLRVSVSALRNWRRDGTGPRFLKLGRLIRYPVSELANWMEGRASS